jgi:putative transposase
VAPLRALIPDFAALLTAPADPATTARIERAPTVGRPLGAPEWIAALERRLGRRLAPGERAQSPEWTGTPSGNCRCCESSSKLSP